MAGRSFRRGLSPGGAAPWLAALLLVTGGASADEAPAADCARAAAERVQAHYDGVRDLRARFVQRVEAAALSGGALASETESRGRVWLAKPGRMRWDYESPEPSLMVSDGELLWMYDPGLREAQRMRVSPQQMGGAALEFLLGGGQLERSFRLEAAACGSEEVHLLLHPREPASYERLELVANAASGEIRRTILVDLLGNRTQIDFGEVATNVDPPDERFHFEPPGGVEVIDLAPGG